MNGPDAALPSGCQHCGVDERQHLQRGKLPVGWHVWTAPTQQQRKARMLARAAASAGLVRDGRTSP